MTILTKINLLFPIGSFPNSKRQIEPELLGIIMQNCQLNNLILDEQDNTKLTEALHLVQSRATAGSLAAYDKFEFAELYRFMQIYRQETDTTITGSEPFPGEILGKIDRISLPDSIYELLISYYNNTYNEWDFVSIAEMSNDLSSNSVLVLPFANQFFRIRIATETFGSVNSPRYQRSSNILAKFMHDDDSVDTYPGQVQFYFEHTIALPIGNKTHQLAFVKWYLFAPDSQTRFYCKINNQDYDSSNIELWKYDFFELSRDAIMPIHNIYSRFVSSKFTVGIRHPTTYMAVIPINRQFHL
jgi:hypothetical protein